MDQSLLGRGFHLACFIVPDRSAALQVLGNAASKFRVQDSREKKRRYWRDKYLKRKINRITRDECDVLQWLIYSESESYEKQQEQSGRPSMRDMVVRYIKHLVQLTTAMSSFYVNIGLRRLLCSYSTSETQQLYEWTTDNYPGNQEYRKVKGVLMNKLEARFDRFLKTCKGPYGELRFETLASQSRWTSLVEECLSIFTPWSTAQSCWVPARFEAGTAPSKLLRDLLGSRDQDVIETYRCHAFIEPDCSRHLTAGLGLNPPRQYLAIPRFFLNGNSEDDDNDEPTSSRKEADLSAEEERWINARLEEEASQRKRVTPRVLRIMGNGAEYARLDLERETERRFEILEGVKLIEIWAHEQGRDILLAKHWVAYTEWEGIAPSEHVVDLGNGKELLLETTPIAGGASLRLKCRRARLTLWFADFLPLLPALHSFPRYALATACLLVIGFFGWLLGTVRHRDELARLATTISQAQTELSRERAARASLEHQLQIAPLATVRLTPDSNIRGQQGVREPTITVSSTSSLVLLELPAGQGVNKSYRATLRQFMSNQEILSENLLKPKQQGDDFTVTFAVPTSLLADRTHYVIELQSVTPPRNRQVFTFYVGKVDSHRM